MKKLVIALCLLMFSVSSFAGGLLIRGNVVIPIDNVFIGFIQHIDDPTCQATPPTGSHPAPEGPYRACIWAVAPSSPGSRAFAVPVGVFDTVEEARAALAEIL